MSWIWMVSLPMLLAGTLCLALWADNTPPPVRLGHSSPRRSPGGRATGPTGSSLPAAPTTRLTNDR